MAGGGLFVFNFQILRTKELKDLPDLHFNRYKSNKSYTLGLWTTLATWTMRPDIEIWLDKAAGTDVHRFWVGFATESKKPMQTLLDLLPEKLAPKKTYTRRDWKPVEKGQYVFKNPREKYFTYPFCEIYPRWATFYFGMYDWEGTEIEIGCSWLHGPQPPSSEMS
jgi:hypothetical protein